MGKEERKRRNATDGVVKENAQRAIAAAAEKLAQTVRVANIPAMIMVDFGPIQFDEEILADCAAVILALEVFTNVTTRPARLKAEFANVVPSSRFVNIHNEIRE